MLLMIDYTKIFDPKLSPAWLAYNLEPNFDLPKHIQFLNAELAKMIAAGNGKMIVNMPPRHGKSELISKYLPFWFLVNHPDKTVILTTYESQFATSWGRKVRDLVDNYGERFGISTDKSSFAANIFRLKDSHGGMICVGAGGALTGRGADLLIIDDPIKNDAEANSKHQRDLLWDWFRSTVFTRIEPAGCIILVMTRWHEDDLTGRLLMNNPDEWKLISLPAIAQEKDAIGREIGDALWEERFSKEQLLKIKESIGAYWFSSLYMQNPTPMGDGIFKRTKFNYFTDDANFFIKNNTLERVIKTNCTKYATLDLAISTNERSDFTAVIIFAVSPERDIFIVDVIAERIAPNKHIDLIKNIYQSHNLTLIGIESVQYQTALIQNAREMGLPVKELRPDKDKFSRAIPMSALVESGKVFFKSNAAWLSDFEHELTAFPNSTHDDMTDAFAYIWQMLSYSSGLMPISLSRKR